MPDLQLVQYLERVPLFARLSDPELAGLAERMRQKAFKRGDTIFWKDDPGQHFYVVLEGAGGSRELELTLTQDDLAAFTGASRVSVNRVLGDLERRDLISIRRRKIAIRDPEKLAKEIRV